MIEEIKSVKRDKILLSARNLFAQRGFEGTTIRQICTDAKVNVSMVSYYFGGKECVFFALFEEYFQRIRLLVSDVPSDPVLGIRVIVENIVRFKLEQPEILAILNQELLMNSQRAAGLMEYLVPVYKKVEMLLEMGRKQNLFHFKSVEETAQHLIAVAVIPKRSSLDLRNQKVRHDMDEISIENTVEFILCGLGYSISLSRRKITVERDEHQETMFSNCI